MVAYDLPVSADDVDAPTRERSDGDTSLPLGFLLVRIAEAVDRGFTAALADLDLTPRQLRLLVVVDREPGLSQRALARQLDIDPGNLVATLDTLERRGQLRRERDGRDRRQRHVQLTNRGRATVDAAQRATAAIDDRILAPLNPTEHDALYDMALDIYRNL